MNTIGKTLIFFCFVSSAISLKSFEIDRITYYFSDPVQKNWYQALRYCHQLGYYLLDLETEEENIKVQQFLLNYKEIPVRTYWTAGTRLGSSGEYYWIISGEDVKYNGFRSDQPDNHNGNEQCLQLWRDTDFLWNDENCDHSHYFICRSTKYFKLNSRISDKPKLL